MDNNAQDELPDTGIPEFKLLHSRRIETLDLTVAQYTHLATGASHYHLEAENVENVFMVALRTVPMDSTGVAHMLEHTALCGSERFPVRDPFFLMIRRSLNTFMNAFTTSDYTAYPFASMNRKDYFNLMDIYLDAVFFSRLDPLDFAQEGHRLEFEDPLDATTPLVYRGVVYNEMKGDSSSPVSALYSELQKHLFPTSTYHYSSGGEPKHIPELN
jgi:Zn-dependent M16 (insulinase) family peptidase